MQCVLTDIISAGRHVRVLATHADGDPLREEVSGGFRQQGILMQVDDVRYSLNIDQVDIAE